MAAIAFVDVLNDLFAAFVLEVDVDVGGFVAGFGHEAFKDHRADFGADAGHAKAITHYRVRRRAAPLAENIAGSGELDDVVNCQEIGLVFQLGDQGQFVVQHVAHLVGRAVRVAPVEPLFRQAAQAV